MSGHTLRLSAGMAVRSPRTGATYRVRGVGEQRVVATGPGGSVGFDRAALESGIQRGVVGVVSWP